MRIRNWLPSPAMLVATIALVLAISGAAVALPGKNKVDKNDIQKNAVGSKQINNGKVKSKDLKDNGIKGKDVKDGALGGDKIADGTLNTVDLADRFTFKEGPTPMTDGADTDAARAAAPEIPLYSSGPIEIYAKCYGGPTSTNIDAAIYVRTSQDGALTGGEMRYPNDGPDLLDADTPEADRLLIGAGHPHMDEAESDSGVASVTSHDLSVQVTIEGYVAAKGGTLPGGDGAFGSGDSCIFQGTITG